MASPRRRIETDVSCLVTGRLQRPMLDADPQGNLGHEDVCLRVQDPEMAER